MKEESEENSLQMDIFQELKHQVYSVREQYRQNLARLVEVEKFKEDLVTVNREMKIKL